MNKFVSQQSNCSLDTTSMQGDVTKITFRGELVYEVIEKVKAKLDRIPLKAKSYIFEMKEVTHIDSTGFGLIVNLAKRLLQNDTKIVFVVCDEIINELFKISQLNRVFPIVKTIDEAINIMGEVPYTKTSFEDYLNMSITNRN